MVLLGQHVLIHVYRKRGVGMKNTFLSICSILPLFLFANTNNIDNNIELNLNFGFHGKTVKKWGEIARFGKRYYRMINSIPPQTDKDLYLYLKIREDGSKNIEFSIRQYDKSVFSYKGDNNKEWQYLRLGPLKSKDLMPNFDICAGKDKSSLLYISRAVLSTNPNLSLKKLSVANTKPFLVIGKGEVGFSCGPFVLQRQRNFAKEKSFLTMYWDEKNLYAQFTNYESSLDPKANRLHEFRTAEKNPLKNDHVILLLKRKKIMYDFIISGNGKLDDFIAIKQDYWSNRNSKWQSNAKVKVAKDEKKWTATIEIPWNSIGGVPKNNEEFEFQGSRRSNSSSEVSSLFPTFKGPHDDDNFGKLKLSNSIIKGSFSLPPFTSKENTFNYLDCDAETEIAFPGVSKKVFRGNKINLSGNGTFTISWKFYDKITRKLIWNSPLYEQNITTSTLKFTGAKTILLNNIPIKSGTLISGIFNTIQLPPKFNGKITIDDLKILPLSNNFTIASEISNVWPNWSSKKLFIPQNSLQMLLFAPKGFPGKTVDDYTVKFNLPQGYKIECVSGYYQNYQLTYTSDGVITFKTPIPYSKTMLGHKYISIFIRAPKEKHNGFITYYSFSKKHNITEIPRKIPVETIEEILGVRPKNFRILTWLEWTRCLTDKKYLDVLAKDLAKVGINELHETPNSHINFSYRFNLKAWSWTLAPFVKMYPDSALTKRDGTKNKILVCPQVIKKPIFEKWLNTQMPIWLKKAGNPKIVGWDFEHNYNNTPFSCFCKDCIKESDIASRNKMVAYYAKLINQTLKRCNPDILFTIYSGYQSASTKEYYCIDWKLFNNIIDMAECGYGRPEKDLHDTLQAIGKTPLVTGAIIRPYDMNSKAYPEQFTCAWLLRRAADATGGILLFEYSTFNGKSLNAIAKVSKIIAKYEDFFRFGIREKVKIPNWKNENVQKISYQQKSILLLFNQDKKSLKFKNKIIPAGEVMVIENY